MKTKHVFFFLAAAGIYALGLVQTTDPDLWWHLKTGEMILKHGVPHTDPFSYTAAGQPWTAHEWLSEVILRLIFGLGGLPALMLAFAYAGLFFGWLIYRQCQGKPYLAGALAFLAFFASRYLWGARPQIFNILMLAVFMTLIQDVRSGRTDWKRLYALPFLTVLWANLHSGYLLGVAVLAVFLLGDTFQGLVLRDESGTVGRARLKHLVLIIFLCIGGACLNPSGYRLLIYPFETLQSAMMQSTILEWQSPTFHHSNYWPFLCLMGLGAFAFMTAPPRKNVSEFLLYAGAMAAGLFARRHIPFFAIVAVPVISKALWEAQAGISGQGFGKIRGTVEGRFRLVRYVLNPLLVALIATGIWTWTGYRLKNNEKAIRKIYPVGAVKFLNKHKVGSGLRIFNEYLWGGYLIWNDIPVFIDGRADLYGDKFFAEYLSIYHSKQSWRDTFSTFYHFRINALLLRTGSSMAEVFRMNRDWKESYRDPTASLFIHRSAEMSKSSAQGGPWNGSKSAVPSSSKTVSS